MRFDRTPAIARAVLLASFSTIACGRGEDPATAGAPTTIAVTVQAARLDTLRDVVVVPGQVVPTAAADQLVAAPEPAQLVEAPKAEGDAVQPGDLLARFEIPAITAEIQARQIDVAEATGKFESARAEAARLTSLQERGLISRNTFDASKSSLALAEAALGQAKSQLDTAKSALDRTMVRARFAGVVTKVLHKVGEMVAGGSNDPVLRVIDPTRLQLAAQVPLAAFERIQPGQTAMVQTVSGPVETATVALRMAPAPAAATGEVRLTLPTPTSLTLDATVQLELLLEERRNIVVVPSQAIQRDGAAAFVWIAGDDRQAHRRDVRVGMATGGGVQLVSGVTAGEQVILTGIAELAEGTPISFRTSSAASDRGQTPKSRGLTHV